MNTTDFPYRLLKYRIREDLARAQDVDLAIPPDWSIYYDDPIEASFDERRLLEESQQRFHSGCKILDLYVLPITFLFTPAITILYRVARFSYGKDSQGNEYTGWDVFPTHCLADVLTDMLEEHETEPIKHQPKSYVN